MIIQTVPFPQKISGEFGPADGGVLAAVLFSVSGTTVSVINSKNVSGVVRNGTGRYRVTFASTLGISNYGVVCGARFQDFNNNALCFAGPNRNTTSGDSLYSTTDLDIVTGIPGSTSVFEAGLVGLFVFDPQGMEFPYEAAATFTVSGTTPTLQRQLNVASIARNSIGEYRATFTSAISMANAAVFGNSRHGDSSTNVCAVPTAQSRHTGHNTQSTTVYDAVVGQFTGNNLADSVRNSLLFRTPSSAPRGTVAAARFHWNGSAVVLDSQYNVASITRQGTGLYTVNFNTELADNNYIMFGSGRAADFNDGNVPIAGLNRNTTSSQNKLSTTQASIYINTSSGTAYDPDTICDLWFVKPGSM